MKKFKQKLVMICMSGLLMAGCLLPSGALAAEEEMRGTWISTVYNADYPAAINDVAGQKQEFIDKLDQLKALGINTVFVQVRPKGDALYVSNLNPWSAVLTGTQGQYPGYDPMAFMIEETHKRGMEFHAWLNPYRVTTSGTDLSVLSADNMARRNPDWVISYNNALYYDPARAEVKQYIVDTVAEIVQNYDVDGIHFDDYFYPSNYPLSSGETSNGAEANQRRAHVNDMIRSVGEKIKSIESGVAYGVSPMGIWKNNTSDMNGSMTRGSEGYYAVFADARAWIDNEWIDYIAPQIYWEQGNAYADYETLVKWWSQAVKGTNVALYIGQGIYKDVVAAEIVEQMKINETYGTDGSIFFSMRDLLNNRAGSGTALKAYWTAQEVEVPPASTKPEVPAAEPEAPTAVIRKTAYVTRSTIYVDGKELSVEVYTIDDYTYFKLRDIASAIRSTDKEFQTIWNEETLSIHLLRGVTYDGSGITIGSATQNAVATTSTAKLYVDGERANVSAYTIQDYTYYKLRDIAKVLDFGVTWSEETWSIGIDTTTGY